MGHKDAIHMGVVVCEVQRRKGETKTKAGKGTAQESSSTQKSRRSVGQQPWAKRNNYSQQDFTVPSALKFPETGGKDLVTLDMPQRNFELKQKLTFYRSRLSFKPNLVPVSV